jgi:hypothetical protein
VGYDVVLPGDRYSTFRRKIEHYGVKQSKKRNNKKKNCLDFGDEGTTFLQNFGNH